MANNHLASVTLYPRNSSPVTIWSLQLVNLSHRALLFLGAYIMRLKKKKNLKQHGLRYTAEREFWWGLYNSWKRETNSLCFLSRIGGPIFINRLFTRWLVPLVLMICQIKSWKRPLSSSRGNYFLMAPFNTSFSQSEIHVVEKRTGQWPPFPEKLTYALSWDLYTRGNFYIAWRLV